MAAFQFFIQEAEIELETSNLTLHGREAAGRTQSFKERRRRQLELASSAVSRDGFGARKFFGVPASDHPEWIHTSKWKPASAGGGSGGYSVECVATGELGHGKPTQVYREILASRLAGEVGVTVPETILANCGGNIIAVSKSFGAQSLDVPTVKNASQADYDSGAFRGALRDESGVLVFHSWLGTQDLKDEHVIVRPEANGVYKVASIDFAIGPLDFASEPEVPTGPPSLVANRDPASIARVLDSIEALSEARIRAIVEDLPEEVLGSAEKGRIVKGLVDRKSALRTKFKAAGWLP